jgi:hypothetical protein
VNLLVANEEVGVYFRATYIDGFDILHVTALRGVKNAEVLLCYSTSNILVQFLKIFSVFERYFRATYIDGFDTSPLYELQDSP